MIWISLACVLACLTYVVIVLLGGLQHGFDLMDEGFYLVISAYPSNFPTLSGFHYLLSMIPHFTKIRIFDFRYSQLVVQVSSSLLLSFGYLHVLEKYRVVKTRPDFALGLLFATLGNLLLFAKFPFSISYNSLAEVSLFGATGLILESSIRVVDKKHLRTSAWLAGLSGVIYGACAFSKLPSFFAFLPVELAIIIISFRTARLKHAIYFLASTMVSIAALTLFFGIRSLWSPDQEFILHYLLSHNTQHGSLLFTYTSTFVDALEHCQSITWLIPAAIIIALTTAPLKKGWRKSYAQISLTIFWLVAGIFLIHSGYLLHDLYRAYVFNVLAATCLCQLFIYAVFLSPGASLGTVWRPSLIALTLLFLPIACSVGTSNPIFYQSTIYLAALFLVIFTASRALSNLVESNLPLSLIIICCSVLSVGQFYDGFVRHPYALGTRLNAQSESSKLKNLEGVKLSRSLNNFLMTTDQTLRANDYHAGDCLLVFYNMPGIVYALDASSQGLGWFNPAPAYADFNAHYLAKIRIKDTQHLYLLVGWKLDKSVAQGLAKSGFKFPEDFRQIGSLRCPVQVGLLDGKPDPNYLQGTNYLYMYKPHNRTKLNTEK